MHRKDDIEFRHEILRKLIHLISLGIPIGYYHLSREVTLSILIPMTVISLVLDLGRFYSTTLAHWFYKVFRPLLRAHELDHEHKLLNGATYVLISATVCVQIFPKIITVAAFTVLIISDSAAALFGRRFGKRRFFQKSLEGSAAFFVSAALVLLLVPHVQNATAEYLVALVGALVAAVVESASIALRFDDNLSIPLSMGGVMYGLYALLAALDPATYNALLQAVKNFN